jgi:hypothetical protein
MKSFLALALTVLCLGWTLPVRAMQMPERQIGRGTDDAEEDVIPSTVTENTPLWACCVCPASGYLCHITGAGLRFTDVQIPHGAIIDSAWLSLLPFISSNDDVACTVYCEAVDNCTTFVSCGQHNISNRTRTQGKALWIERDAGSDWVESCNLAALVQEVVNRPGWHTGNALAFILIPGDSAGEWRSNLQFQAWELMNHAYGAKFNCMYTASDARPDTYSIDFTPREFKSFRNFPNPFNPETQITFVLDHSRQVTVELFDVLGRKVKRLVRGNLSAGLHSIQWDGKDEAGEDVGSGIYFCRVTVGDATATRKLVLLR